MVNSEQHFLEELQDRLEENRVLAEKTILPQFLQKPASYLAFHHFRTLFWLSLAITVALFAEFYPLLVRISKAIFLYE